MSKYVIENNGYKMEIDGSVSSVTINDNTVDIDDFYDVLDLVKCQQTSDLFEQFFVDYNEGVNVY